jgi:hypothetical protein
VERDGVFRDHADRRPAPSSSPRITRRRRKRDRKFESLSLQRRVTCELVLAASRAEGPDRMLFASAGQEMTERQDHLKRRRHVPLSQPNAARPRPCGGGSTGPAQRAQRRRLAPARQPGRRCRPAASRRGWRHLRRGGAPATSRLAAAANTRPRQPERLSKLGRGARLSTPPADLASAMVRYGIITAAISIQ